MKFKYFQKIKYFLCTNTFKYFKWSRHQFVPPSIQPLEVAAWDDQVPARYHSTIRILPWLQHAESSFTITEY